MSGNGGAKFGYKLMTEEHGPTALVENAVRAEAAGFDFASISDHYHPWHEAQGHSPFAWSVLGAIAQATSKIALSTGLTCPIIRYHPAIIAQAAATVSLLSGGRFTLALGAGEQLNEHVTGARWPSIPERHAMLGEAIEICRMLWEGAVCNHRGDYFVVHHARLYDPPEKDLPIVLGVSGEHSLALAREKADGIMATQASRELADGFGKKGPRYCEVAVSYAASEAKARKQARERFAFSPLGWAVNSELSTTEGFDAIAPFVRDDDLSDIPCGTDPEPVIKAVDAFLDAGFDHVCLLGIGPDQAQFIDFCEHEVLPRLRA